MADDSYVFVNNKMLRRGHTTGTCAAAATKAATEALLSGRSVDTVTIHTPKGITLDLPVEDMQITDSYVSCAVRKDGGDDIDATHGTLVYSKVSKAESGINIDGGVGVGRVTRCMYPGPMRKRNSGETILQRSAVRPTESRKSR